MLRIARHARENPRLVAAAIGELLDGFLLGRASVATHNLGLIRELVFRIHRQRQRMPARMDVALVFEPRERVRPILLSPLRLAGAYYSSEESRAGDTVLVAEPKFVS